MDAWITLLNHLRAVELLNILTDLPTCDPATRKRAGPLKSEAGAQMSLGDVESMCFLWCFNIEELKCENDTDPDWLAYFDDLQPHEQERVKRYHFLVDRKRSLVSFLSQKAIVKHVFKCSDSDYRLERTREV